jgi:hypothetical protein
VNEYVGTVVLLNEPEALGVIEPFHRTLCHVLFSSFARSGGHVVLWALTSFFPMKKTATALLGLCGLRLTDDGGSARQLNH